ncbi:hypothetical protein [Myroides odoratus]|uniref:Sugar O-acyltransferase, sialic acid O-acetyltransferase NeuD family n=1 Tax=Myroides odoratus TaxID=256 RepID=A0A378RQB5_MYROD|nr:hypothetical protein [Myroides odoratus]QQU04103.1 hypothetical protein I6I89_02070 [Myroides odoratus]STZ28501.1 sugar O-acyltransferase, sialic acid O-acetyltransferase NeuD family [Myroides odoratus]
MKKYKLTEESMIHKGYTLWRIEYIATGAKGGWVESEKNLSQLGDCMILDNAKVYGDATISDHAIICNEAEIYEQASVYGHAIVSEQASIHGNAQVNEKVSIKKNTQVSGTAHVKQETIVATDKHLSDDQFTWNEINSLVSLKLITQHVQASESQTLYANGRHQIQVQVLLEALDIQGNYISIPSHEIFKNIQWEDENHTPLNDIFLFSDIPGKYVSSLAVENENEITERKISNCLFYLSTTQVLGKIKLHARCLMHHKTVPLDERTEDTHTSNHLNIVSNSLPIHLVEARTFQQKDITVETIEKIRPDSYNSILKSYYVNFSSNTDSISESTDIQDEYWFNYRQKGNYKACSTTTDNSVRINYWARFTTTFHITDKWKITITEKKHERSGACFWVYRVWHGALWANHIWRKPMVFNLYDQYGNHVTIKVNVLEDAVLEFIVVSP